MRRTAGALAVTLALAGCGGGDDGDGADDRAADEQAAVVAVVAELGAAAREGDTKRICEDLITIELQRSVRQASGTSCAKEFEENIVSDRTRFEVEAVQVQGSNASAAVVDQRSRRSTIVFQRVGSDWRIARIQ